VFANVGATDHGHDPNHGDSHGGSYEDPRLSSAISPIAMIIVIASNLTVAMIHLRSAARRVRTVVHLCRRCT
jgi:hypothetical protein